MTIKQIVIQMFIFFSNKQYKGDQLIYFSLGVRKAITSLS